MAQGGRPLKYKTVEELQTAIDAYFKDCEGTILRDKEGHPCLDKFGNPIILDSKPPTVTGLALALGFSGRQALLTYQGRKPFYDTVTRAKARCEAYTEARLFDRDGVHGARFSLINNFRGWRDKPEEQGDSEGVQIIDDV